MPTTYSTVISTSYNGEPSVSQQPIDGQATEVTYNGTRLDAKCLTGSGSGVLNCGGKLMRGDVVIGSRVFRCGGKVMRGNITFSAVTTSVTTYVWDKYARKEKDYSWSAALVKADTSTEGTLSNAYACMVYDLVSAKSNGVDVSPSGKDTATVDGNGAIHWPPYWTGTASAFQPFVGHFGAANSDSLRTHNSAVEGETTTNYLLVKSVTQRLWGVTTKGDVYGIGAGRATTNYMAGDHIGQVTSTNRSSYPDNGEQDGYWFIFRG